MEYILRLLKKIETKYKPLLDSKHNYQSPDLLRGLNDDDVYNFAAFFNLLPFEPKNHCIIIHCNEENVSYSEKITLTPCKSVQSINIIPDNIPIKIVSNEYHIVINDNRLSELLQLPNVSFVGNMSETEIFGLVAQANYVVGVNNVSLLWASYIGHRMRRKDVIILCNNLQSYNDLYQ